MARRVITAREQHELAEPFLRLAAPEEPFPEEPLADWEKDLMAGAEAAQPSGITADILKKHYPDVGDYTNEKTAEDWFHGGDIAAQQQRAHEHLTKLTTPGHSFYSPEPGSHADRWKAIHEDAFGEPWTGEVQHSDKGKSVAENAADAFAGAGFKVKTMDEFFNDHAPPGSGPKAKGIGPKPEDSSTPYQGYLNEFLDKANSPSWFGNDPNDEWTAETEAIKSPAFGEWFTKKYPNGTDNGEPLYPDVVVGEYLKEKNSGSKSSNDDYDQIQELLKPVGTPPPATAPDLSGMDENLQNFFLTDADHGNEYSELANNDHFKDWFNENYPDFGHNDMFPQDVVFEYECPWNTHDYESQPVWMKQMSYGGDADEEIFDWQREVGAEQIHDWKDEYDDGGLQAIHSFHEYLDNLSIDHPDDLDVMMHTHQDIDTTASEYEYWKDQLPYGAEEYFAEYPTQGGYDYTEWQDYYNGDTLHHKSNWPEGPWTVNYEQMYSDQSQNASPPEDLTSGYDSFVPGFKAYMMTQNPTLEQYEINNFDRDEWSHLEQGWNNLSSSDQYKLINLEGNNLHPHQPDEKFTPSNAPQASTPTPVPTGPVVPLTTPFPANEHGMPTTLEGYQALANTIWGNSVGQGLKDQWIETQMAGGGSGNTHEYLATTYPSKWQNWQTQQSGAQAQPGTSEVTPQMVIDHLVGQPGSSWQWNPENHSMSSGGLLDLPGMTPDQIKAKLEAWAKSTTVAAPAAAQAQKTLDALFGSGTQQAAPKTAVDYKPKTEAEWNKFFQFLKEGTTGSTISDGVKNAWKTQTDENWALNLNNPAEYMKNWMAHHDSQPQETASSTFHQQLVTSPEFKAWFKKDNSFDLDKDDKDGSLNKMLLDPTNDWTMGKLIQFKNAQDKIKPSKSAEFSPDVFAMDYKNAFPGTTYTGSNFGSPMAAQNILQNIIDEDVSDGVGYYDGDDEFGRGDDGPNFPDYSEYQDAVDEWQQEKGKAQDLYDKYFGDNDNQGAPAYDFGQDDAANQYGQLLNDNAFYDWVTGKTGEVNHKAQMFYPKYPQYALDAWEAKKAEEAKKSQGGAAAPAPSHTPQDIAQAAKEAGWWYTADDFKDKTLEQIKAKLESIGGGGGYSTDTKAIANDLLGKFFGSGAPAFDALQAATEYGQILGIGSDVHGGGQAYKDMTYDEFKDKLASNIEKAKSGSFYPEHLDKFQALYTKLFGQPQAAAPVGATPQVNLGDPAPLAIPANPGTTPATLMSGDTLNPDFQKWLWASMAPGMSPENFLAAIGSWTPEHWTMAENAFLGKSQPAAASADPQALKDQLTVLWNIQNESGQNSYVPSGGSYTQWTNNLSPEALQHFIDNPSAGYDDFSKFMNSKSQGGSGGTYTPPVFPAATPIAGSYAPGYDGPPAEWMQKHYSGSGPWNPEKTQKWWSGTGQNSTAADFWKNDSHGDKASFPLPSAPASGFDPMALAQEAADIFGSASATGVNYGGKKIKDMTYAEAEKAISQGVQGNWGMSKQPKWKALYDKYFGSGASAGQGVAPVPFKGGVDFAKEYMEATNWTGVSPELINSGGLKFSEMTAEQAKERLEAWLDGSESWGNKEIVNPQVQALYDKYFGSAAAPSGTHDYDAINQLAQQMSHGGGGNYFTDVSDWMVWAHGLDSSQLKAFLADPQKANKSFTDFLTYDGELDPYFQMRDWAQDKFGDSETFHSAAKDPQKFGKLYNQWKQESGGGDLGTFTEAAPPLPAWLDINTSAYPSFTTSFDQKSSYGDWLGNWDDDELQQWAAHPEMAQYSWQHYHDNDGVILTPDEVIKGNTKEPQAPAVGTGIPKGENTPPDMVAADGTYTQLALDYIKQSGWPVPGEKFHHTMWDKGGWDVVLKKHKSISNSSGYVPWEKFKEIHGGEQAAVPAPTKPNFYDQFQAVMGHDPDKIEKNKQLIAEKGVDWVKDQIKKRLKVETDPEKFVKLVDLWQKNFGGPTGSGAVTPLLKKLKPGQPLNQATMVKLWQLKDTGELPGWIKDAPTDTSDDLWPTYEEQDDPLGSGTPAAAAPVHNPEIPDNLGKAIKWATPQLSLDFFNSTGNFSHNTDEIKKKALQTHINGSTFDGATKAKLQQIYDKFFGGGAAPQSGGMTFDEMKDKIKAADPPYWANHPEKFKDWSQKEWLDELKTMVLNSKSHPSAFKAGEVDTYKEIIDQIENGGVPQSSTSGAQSYPSGLPGGTAPYNKAEVLKWLKVADPDHWSSAFSTADSMKQSLEGMLASGKASIANYGEGTYTNKEMQIYEDLIAKYMTEPPASNSTSNKGIDENYILKKLQEADPQYWTLSKQQTLKSNNWDKWAWKDYVNKFYKGGYSDKETQIYKELLDHINGGGVPSTTSSGGPYSSGLPSGAAPYNINEIQKWLKKADIGHWTEDEFLDDDGAEITAPALKEKISALLENGTNWLNSSDGEGMYTEKEMQIYKDLLDKYFGEGTGPGAQGTAPPPGGQYPPGMSSWGGGGGRSAPAPSMGDIVKGQLSTLVDKLRAPESEGIYNEDDITVAQSPEFQQWFRDAPAPYRQTTSQFPSMALEDYAKGGEYGWVPESTGDIARVYDPYSYQVSDERGGYVKGPNGEKLRLPGGDWRRHWPGNTKNPEAEKSKGRPTVKFPNRPPDVPGQLEIPLPDGSSWEPDKQWPTLRRGIKIKLDRYKPGGNGYEKLKLVGAEGDQHRRAAQLLDEIKELIVGSRSMRQGEEKLPTLFDGGDDGYVEGQPEVPDLSGSYRSSTVDKWLKLMKWAGENNVPPEQMWQIAKDAGHNNPEEFGTPPQSYFIEQSKRDPARMAKEISRLTGEEFQSDSLYDVSRKLKKIRDNDDYGTDHDKETRLRAEHLYEKWFGSGFITDMLAHKIVDYVEAGAWKPSDFSDHPNIGGMGPHWTTKNTVDFGDDSPDDNTLPVQIVMEWPGLGEDPDRKDGARGYESEREITLNPNSPVRVKQLVLRHPYHEHNKHITYDFDKPVWRHATVAPRRQGRTVLTHQERFAADDDPGADFDVWPDPYENRPINFGQPTSLKTPRYDEHTRPVHDNGEYYFSPEEINPPSNSTSRPDIRWIGREPEQDVLPDIDFPDEAAPGVPVDRHAQPLFRGLSLDLTHPDAAEIHRMVYGHHPDDHHLFDLDHTPEPRYDHPELGRAILDHLEHARQPTHGLGRHWSLDPSEAHGFAISEALSLLNDPDSIQLPVRLRADWMGAGENPYRHETGEIGKQFSSEMEMNILPGANMNIGDVQIRHPQLNRWVSLDHQPQHRHAQHTTVRPRSAKRILTHREMMEG